MNGLNGTKSFFREWVYGANTFSGGNCHSKNGATTFFWLACYGAASFFYFSFTGSKNFLLLNFKFPGPVVPQILTTPYAQHIYHHPLDNELLFMFIFIPIQQQRVITFIN